MVAVKSSKWAKKPDMTFVRDKTVFFKKPEYLLLALPPESDERSIYRSNGTRTNNCWSEISLPQKSRLILVI